MLRLVPSMPKMVKSARFKFTEPVVGSLADHFDVFFAQRSSAVVLFNTDIGT